ncbi:hypothetical protein ACHAXT_008879 [Thalassiosira profunda]
MTAAATCTLLAGALALGSSPVLASHAAPSRRIGTNAISSNFNSNPPAASSSFGSSQRICPALDASNGSISRRQHNLHTRFASPSESTISQPSGDGSAAEKAQSLIEKAKALRLEAVAAEQKLRSATQQKKDTAKEAADGWIDTLIGATTASVASDTISKAEVGGRAVDNVIPTSQTLALRLQESNLVSEKKLLAIVERLHERETAMMMGPEGYLSKDASLGDSSGGFVLGDYDNNSIERKREETDRISGLLDRVLQAVQILGEESAFTESENAKMSELASKLRVRASDLRQNRDALFRRRVDNLANSGSGPKGDDSIDGYVRGSIGGSGSNDDKGNKRSKEEKLMERLIETPPWMPSQLAAFAATSPVDVELKHWKMIKTDLLADSDFVCTSWDSTDVAAVYRGRLPRKPASIRSSEEAEDDEEQSPGDNFTAVFEDLQTGLEKHVELKDRIRLFLVDDNEWRPSFDTSGSYGTRMGDWRDTEEEGPPPVIVALASEVEPEQESERGVGTKSLAAFSSLLTVCTTFAYALSTFALNPTFFNAVVKENDVTPVPLCLPIFFGVLAISALHEIGHVVAAKKHKIKLGSPVPLPSLQVGSFGSITPLRSFPSSRSALFDLAISGPGIAMMVSLALLISGLNLTLGARSLATFPVVPAALMKSSFLIGSIVSVVAPKMMLVPLSQPIPVHPIFFVGLAGTVMSAVNLLPIGRLDGGRAFMAAWGRRMASLVSFLSLLALAFFSFSGTSGIIIFWGALVVMTQRLPDIPCVDEVTGVGDVRVNSYLVLLALSTLTLAPFPNGVGSM